MKTDFSIEIETDAEEAFLDMIVEARSAGHEAGLSQHAIARVFMIFAHGLLSDTYQNTSENPPIQQDDDAFTCPICDARVTALELPGIGETPKSADCGHNIPYKDIPDTTLQTLMDDG
jgi:hypothetical protein